MKSVVQLKSFVLMFFVEKRELDTPRLHRRDVAVLLDLTADTLRHHQTDQIEVVALVPVNGQVDAVVRKLNPHRYSALCCFS